MKLEFWSELDENLWPRLHGVIHVNGSAYDRWDNPPVPFVNDEQELRVCIEFCHLDQFFKDRSDRIKFFGKVGDGKFSEPQAIHQDHVNDYIDNRYWWGTVRNYEKEYLDGDPKKTDLTIIRTAIFKDPANYALIEFTRPFITSQIQTINFIGSFKYDIYLSWGIFDSEEDWNYYKVKGDVKLNTFKTP